MTISYYIIIIIIVLFKAYRNVCPCANALSMKKKCRLGPALVPFAGLHIDSLNHIAPGKISPCKAIMPN